MKFLVCCVAAFAVIECANGYYRRRPYSNDETMLDSFLQNRQRADGYGRFLDANLGRAVDKDYIRTKASEICPGYGDKLLNSSMEMISCFNLVDENQETACSLIQNHFERCLQPIIGTLEDCLPEESSGIPALFVKSTIKLSDHLCKTDGEHIFELGNPCVKTFNHRTQSCVRRVKVKIQQYSRKTPSSQDICDFLGSFRPCVQSHLQSSCGNPKTREAFLEFYDVAISVCNPTSTNEVEIVSPALE